MRAPLHDRISFRGFEWAAVFLLAALWLAAGCGGSHEEGHSEEHAEGEAHEGEEHGEDEEGAARGPHGGRLLESKGTRLELVIVEEGDQPHYDAYLVDAKNRTVPWDGAGLRLVLRRLGGDPDTVTFQPTGEGVRSRQAVEEPHSFTARVLLTAGGRRHEWEFEETEGRIELDPEAIRAAGIDTAKAGPASIEVTVEAPGEVRMNAERVVQVRPRFPGLVREMRKRLGDPVRRGEVLAQVHSNESLANYAITASLGGTIVSQDVAVGQAVDHESILYTVADLSTVWVDFPIYSQNAGLIRPGLQVHVRSETGPSLSGVGTVRYVGPILEQDTRVSYGRVVLDNRDRRWQPGMYVAAAVAVERVDVAVAVPEEAIMRLADGPAVFRAAGNRFQAQPVTLGRTDGTRTEIVGGLESGATFVVRNAFLLKAEMGKSEAHHEH
jgi:cobalt-zinc-cadmium efflux system membrane fusion protein